MPPPPPVELILERLRTVVLPAESGAGKRGPLSELFLGRAEIKLTKCSQKESLFFKYILDQYIINMLASICIVRSYIRKQKKIGLNAIRNGPTSGPFQMDGCSLI